MVDLSSVHLVLHCFIISVHSFKQFPRNDLVATVSMNLKKNTNLELKPRNYAFNYAFTKNEYIKDHTELDNKRNSKLNTKTIHGNTEESNNLMLTTSQNTLHKNANKAFNNQEKEVKFNNNEEIQNVEELEYSVQDNDISESDLIRTVPSTSAARRIFHGHKTKIHHFPFLVTVHVLRRFICSGSIIRSNLVITAASCLKRWQEWKEYVARNKTHSNKTKKATVNADTYETIIDLSTAHVTDLYSTDSEVYSTATEIYNPDVTATEVNNADETDTATAKETEAPTTTTIATTTIATTVSVETSTDWTTTTPTETTVTEQETTTIWSETQPPKLGELAVRIGTNYYRLGGKVVNVVKVYIHPQYKYGNLHNNLAIMRLERHLSLTHRRVNAVEFSREAADVPEGTEVTIVGWGAKTYHNKVYNALWNLIHKAVLTVSDRKNCTKVYTRRFVKTANFCALNEHNEGACNRDLGDPAVVGNLLVGLVSFGSPNCGPPNNPTVFTNLGYYADWIDETIEEVKKDDIVPELEYTTRPDVTTEAVVSTVHPTTVPESEGLGLDSIDKTERRNWLDMKYLRYRRFQNQSHLKPAEGKGNNELVDQETNRYDVGVLTVAPVKVNTILRPDISISKETDKNKDKFTETDENNAVLNTTKANYDTLDQPDNIYRPTKSISEIYEFTPLVKNPDTLVIDSKLEEGYLSKVLTTEQNREAPPGSHENDIEDDKTTGNSLHDANDYEVTHSVKYQIEAPPKTFSEIKDEMDKIIEQFDISRMFGSTTRNNWKKLDKSVKSH